MMKKDRIIKLASGVPSLSKQKTSLSKSKRRYRLDFIAESTFNRVWTIRFTRLRLILFSAIVVSAIAALVFVVFFFSPARHLLPGRLEGDLRLRYVDMAFRLDSIEQKSELIEKFYSNMANALLGKAEDQARANDARSTTTPTAADSMLMASEAERNFVKMYEAEDRFNLSVLTPIAGETMIFYSPVPDVLVEPQLADNVASVSFVQVDVLPVSSVYRGTVVASNEKANGEVSVVVQHPNDFISVYSGLNQTYKTAGDKVQAGEQLGMSGKGKPFTFELWHNGVAANPIEYIGF